MPIEWESTPRFVPSAPLFSISDLRSDLVALRNDLLQMERVGIRGLSFGAGRRYGIGQALVMVDVFLRSQSEGCEVEPRSIPEIEDDLAAAAF